MRIASKHIIRFVLVVLIQVILLNNLYLSNFCNPYIYIFFLLSLPANSPRWLDLLLGFMLGMTIDIFSNTMGMHTFATVFIAYIRYFIIKLLVSDEEKLTKIPSFENIGMNSYIKYMLILTALHHTTLFFLEAFSLTNLLNTILCIIISTVVSMCFMLTTQFGRK